MPRPKSPPKKKTTRKPYRKPAMKKAEIAKIAKAAVTQVAEKKYMNPEQFRGLVPNLVTGNDKISVLGFTTGVNYTENGSVIMFGDTECKQLKCLRPFDPSRIDTLPDPEVNNLVIGKEVKPVYSCTRIRLSRQASSQDLLDPGSVYGSDQNPPTPGIPPPQYPIGLMENCPVACRVIRVTPKLSSGLATEISPNDDLFMDEKGDPFSVNSGTFDEREVAFYKVNTRRYTKINDYTITLQNPLSVNYTWANNETAPDANQGWWVPQVTNGSNNCEKHLTFYHQLTKKKHGSVRYKNPMISMDSDTAMTGLRREYIFLLMYYKGGDSISRIANSTLFRGPVDIDIDVKNVTKFIDV